MLSVQKNSILQLIKNKTDYLSSVEQAMSKISEVKSKLSGSGINIDNISRWQQSVNAQSLEGIRQPAAIKEATRNLLPANGIQRLFESITSLNAGTFGNNLSERTVSALLSGGAQLSGLTNNNFLSGGFGKIKDGSYLKDADLESSIYSAPVSMQYAQIGKGATGSSNNARITVLNSNTFSPNSLRYQAISMALKRGTDILIIRNSTFEDQKTAGKMTGENNLRVEMSGRVSRKDKRLA